MTCHVTLSEIKPLFEKLVEAFSNIIILIIIIIIMFISYIAQSNIR